MRIASGAELIRAGRTILILLVLLVLAASLVRQFKLLDRHLLFFPSREVSGDPAQVGLPFEDVRFQAADGVNLHGWFVPGSGDTTLLWFHGNAGNIGDRIENILVLNRSVGVNVFIFDYRGYGLSEGSPSEKGIYLDAEAAIAYLTSRPDVDRDGGLVVFGRSLGAAVAVEMATRQSFRGVILESPFTSVKAMARRTNPILSRLVPVGLIVQSRFDSLAKMSEVVSPILVVHGRADETVPVEMGVALFEAANDPKRLHLIDGAGHNDTYLVGGEDYFEAIEAFISGAGE